MVLFEDPKFNARAGQLVKKYGLIHRENGNVGYNERKIIEVADLLDKTLEERDCYRDSYHTYKRAFDKVLPELQAYRESNVLKARGSDMLTLQIAKEEGTVTPKVLADRSSITPNSAARCMKRLAERGLLQKVQRGIYKLTKEGKAIAKSTTK